MNQIKRLLGFVWMALCPLLLYFMLSQAFQKIGMATAIARPNVILQWSIILIIFIPICIAFFIFGLYSKKGFYDT